MEKLSDGNFVFTGLNFPSIFTVPEGEALTYPIQVTKIDEDGEVIWSIQDTLIKNPIYFFEPTIEGITELESGNIVVYG